MDVVRGRAAIPVVMRKNRLRAMREVLFVISTPVLLSDRIKTKIADSERASYDLAAANRLGIQRKKTDYGEKRSNSGRR